MTPSLCNSSTKRSTKNCTKKTAYFRLLVSTCTPSFSSCILLWFKMRSPFCLCILLCIISTKPAGDKMALHHRKKECSSHFFRWSGLCYSQYLLFSSVFCFMVFKCSCFTTGHLFFSLPAPQHTVFCLMKGLCKAHHMILAGLLLWRKCHWVATNGPCGYELYRGLLNFCATHEEQGRKPTKHKHSQQVIATATDRHCPCIV